MDDPLSDVPQLLWEMEFAADTLARAVDTEAGVAVIYSSGSGLPIVVVVNRQGQVLKRTTGPVELEAGGFWVHNSSVEILLVDNEDRIFKTGVTTSGHEHQPVFPEPFPWTDLHLLKSEQGEDSMGKFEQRDYFMVLSQQNGKFLLQVYVKKSQN